MHRHFKAAAAVTWATSILLFVIGAFENHDVERYNYYAFAVLSAMFAVTFTCVSALETVVSRIFQREAALSREVLARTVAVAIVDEMESRDDGGVTHIHRAR